MLVVSIDGLVDSAADVNEESVGDLIHQRGKKEVACVAERGAGLRSYFFVPELIDGEACEDEEGCVHDAAHQLADLAVVFEEVRRLLRVKVANLEENQRLDEA